MKFSFLFFMLFIVGITKGTDYYVSSTGNNVNNGTSQTTPWQTLSKVQSMFNNGTISPGDKVMFKKGDVFTGTLLVSSIWGYNAKSGTSTNPITIGTYGTGAKPVFQYPSSNTTTLVNRVTMWFVGVNYYVIDGLNYTELTDTVNDKIAPANCAFGIYLGTYGEATCNYFTIKNVDISLTGMGMTLVGNFNKVMNCSLTNFKNLKSTNDGGTDDYGANAITIMGDDNQVLNNYISGAWAQSYDFGWNGGAWEMYNTCNRNKFLYNTVVDCGGITEYGGQGSAGHVANDNMVAYNKIINCGSLAWFNMSGPFAMQGSNLQFFNNVVVENNLSRFSGPNVGAGNAHPLAQYPSPRLFGYSGSANAATVYNLKNNIFIQSTGINIINANDAPKTIHQNNIYKMTGGATNFTLAASELSTSASVLTSTGSTDPQAWNYTPLLTGPAIDFGQNVGISNDFAGNVVPSIPNAGILELATGSPTALAATATAGTILCRGNSTTVTVSATGGAFPYTGTGSFTATAGSYTYTVTDAAGAIKTVTVVITQPSAIVVSATAGTITVNGGSTSITATATGGTGTYTFQLNTGAYQSSGSFNGVVAGTHTINVKDANGCIISRSITITQPAPAVALSANYTAGSINCNGGSATVTITASGGTSPYTGTGNFTVTAGTYSYTIRDAANNTKTLSVTVTQPTTIIGTVTAPAVPSATATTIATITASGGSAPYTYKLNNGAYQAGLSFAGVPAGSHSITIKDSKGCTLIKNFTVAVSVSPLVVTTNAGWITCNGGNTSVVISATGGVSPYTGTGTFTMNAGTQSFTVRDAAGTTVVKSVSVVQPSAISLTITSGTIVVYNGSTTLNVVSSGGTSTHTYKLNTGSFQSAASFTGVKAGTHTITVKDVRGCTATKTITLVQPAQGTFSILLTAKTNQTCSGNNNGTITVNGMAGTLPYTFKRGNANNYTSNNIFSNLAPGNHTLYGRDATGAISSIVVNIASSSVPCSGKAIEGITTAVLEGSLGNENTNGNLFTWQAYPNPTRSGFTLHLKNAGNEKIKIIVCNTIGQRVFETISSPSNSIIIGNEWRSGTYFVTVIQGKNSQTTRLVKLQ